MKVTICGSMRFIPEMLKWYEKFSLEGYLVYLPVFVGATEMAYPREWIEYTGIKIPHYSLSEETKDKLQQLHFEKIEDSDFIFVVNPRGYVGEGTRAEIEFAKKHLGHLPVPIVYLEKPDWELSPMEGVWKRDKEGK